MCRRVGDDAEGPEGSGPLGEFLFLRPKLLRLARRIVGDPVAAEDVVQEAWIRYQRTDTRPDSPEAYLVTVVTRLAIHEVGSARARRVEPAPGERFPEQRAPSDQEPEARQARREEVEEAARVLLARLTAAERAAFLLHDVFAVPFAETAGMLGRTEAGCRQLASRARRHVAADTERFDVDHRSRRDLVVRMVLALEDGRVDVLARHLCEEATVHPEPGREGPGLRSPVTGRAPVARLLATLGVRLTAVGVRAEVVDIAGEPGAVLRDPTGDVVLAVSFSQLGGQVQGIRPMTDPSVLRVHGPIGDPASVRRAIRERAVGARVRGQAEAVPVRGVGQVARPGPGRASRPR